MDLGLRLSFLMGLVISALAMKAISVSRAPESKRRELFSFAFSPLVSIQSWLEAPKVTSLLLRKTFGAAIKYSLLLLFAYSIFWKLVEVFHPPKLAIPYLAIFPALLLGEAIGPWIQLVYSVSGRIVARHHNSPLVSKNIMEFWGTRWNVWLSDWFREEIFRPLRRSPVQAALGVFIFSGVWHELIINLPAKIFFDLSLVGSMMLYFLFQCLGVVIDRNLLKKDQLVSRRILTWVFVAGPAPLILNEAILRIVFLWPFN